MQKTPSSQKSQPIRMADYYKKLKNNQEDKQETLQPNHDQGKEQSERKE